MAQKFSDRIRATHPRRELQLQEMDSALRNALWNWLSWALRGGDHDPGRYWYTAATFLWDEVFHLPTDEIPSHPIAYIKKRFMAEQWFEVYNLIEYLLPRINYIRGNQRRADLVEQLNYYLEREMCGYRAVRDQLVAITSPVEVDSVDEAATPKTGFEGVAEHIDTALALLGKKPEPDYRNSIKESISAVEAVVKLLTGEKSGGIDKAIALLENSGALHPSFKVALAKLYGYSSDKEGIRHPILEESSVNFAEAKFMLVACSAFVNLLIDSSRKESAQ